MQTIFFFMVIQSIHLFQGGNNAGHTVVVDGARYEFHILPSGIVNADCIAVIGRQCIINNSDVFLLDYDLTVIVRFWNILHRKRRNLILIYCLSNSVSQKRSFIVTTILLSFHFTHFSAHRLTPRSNFVCLILKYVLT